MANRVLTAPPGSSLVLLASVVALLSLAGTASADEKGSTITMKTTTVVGRYAKPSVTIEVSRARPEIKLKDLQDPAVEKIVRAAAKAPF